MRPTTNKPVNLKARSVVRGALAAGAVLFGLSVSALAAEPEDVWPDLKQQMFGERVVTEDATAVTLDAPYRADDAALVPITIKVPASLAPSAKKISLVIDKNPSPVAAEFTFGPAAGSGDRMISTRVRVDMYSNIRAIVETADGRLLMSTKFVKAAGGCSAPALKDTDAALAEAGKMQIKTLEEMKGGLAEGEIKIRHPQYSGLQLNQATGYYIPAKFLRKIEILRGSDLVLRVDGGISLSENPNIRFTFSEPEKADADKLLAVNAEDTDGKTFQGKEQPKGS